MSFISTLKSALGMKTDASALMAEFNKRADRIAEKASIFIEERNGFSKTAHRIRSGSEQPRKKGRRKP